MSETLQSMPLEPLEKLVRLRTDMPSEFDDTFTDALFATYIGVSKRSVARWRVTGQIPWTTADQVAINLNLHPYDIWGEAWLALDGYVLTKKDIDDIDKALTAALAETTELMTDTQEILSVD